MENHFKTILEISTEPTKMGGGLSKEIYMAQIHKYRDKMKIAISPPELDQRYLNANTYRTTEFHSGLPINCLITCGRK